MKSILVSCVLSISMFVSAQNINQWRGETRMGIYNENGLLKEWPESGPALVWHYDGLGKGFSSPIINSGKIYITGMEGSDGYIYCLNTKGELVWKKKYGEEWTTNFPGTRTTPCYNDGHLYFMSTPGLAVCMKAENGEVVWQNNMAETYGAEQLRFGMAESPIIVNDKVIYTPGGTKATMVAFDTKTGKEIWTNNLEGQKSAYCSPLLINHNGTELLVTCVEKNVVGLNPDNGELYWSQPQTNRYGIHPNTPVYDGENIYSITGYGVGALMVKLSEDGKEASLVWKNESLDNQMGGFIYLDGNIYGSGQNNRAWQCLDAKTGKVKYSSEELMQGAVIFNDGLLYCYSDKTGTISIMLPTTDKFEIKGSTVVGHGSDQHWAHPVICNGVLYVRHGNSLLAYNIKK